MRSYNYRWLLACLALMPLASCQDYENGFDVETVKKASYAKDFEKTFGTVDPNQDWSMATPVQANVNLNGLTGTAKMNICTDDPRLSTSRLLAQIMLKDGQGSISFDAIKGSNNVFVTVEQDGAYKLFGRFDVINGALNIGEFTSTPASTRAFSAECPTQKDGEPYEIGVTFMPLSTGGSSTDPTPMVTYITYNWVKKTLDEWKQQTEEALNNAGGTNHSQFQYNQGSNCPFKWQSIVVYHDNVNNDPNQGFDGLVWDNYELNDGAVVTNEPAGGSGGSTPTASHVKVQYLTGIETQAATPWTRGEAYSLYGVGGFFEEYKHYYKSPKLDTYGTTDEEKKAVVEKIEADFDIITTEAGPVSVPFVYGATSNNNQLGYIICDPDEDPLTQTHYILMNDGRPQSNVYQDSWKGGTENGFTGTSIFDSFIQALNPTTGWYYSHKDDPITCYCTPGSGIWSQAYGMGESDGVDREGSGVYSSAMAHGSCKDPMKEYLDIYNTKVYGTEYLLSYWDKEANGGQGAFTYTVPAGKRIVFFVLTHSAANSKVASTYNDNDFTYSLPSLNKRVNHLYWNTESPTFEAGNNVPGDPKARGAVGSVAWKVGDKIYMGFGDGGNDEDLNDIIFVVNGGFDTNDLVTLYPVKWHMNYNGSHNTSDTDLYHRESNKPGAPYSQPTVNPKRDGYVFKGWATTPTGTPIEGSKDRVVINGTTPEAETCYFAIWEPLNDIVEPEPMSWIFACEDLGGSFDYDFNDVVWEVIHAAGTTELKVKLLAAGGTLPFELQYNGTKITTKAEAGLTVTKVYEGPLSLEYTLPAVSADWTVLANKDKFRVIVGDETSSITEVYAKGGDKTPQVIVLPSEWEWPTEGTLITEAYTNFKNWVADGTVKWSDWRAAKVNGKTVTR